MSCKPSSLARLPDTLHAANNTTPQSRTHQRSCLRQCPLEHTKPAPFRKSTTQNWQTTLTGAQRTSSSRFQVLCPRSIRHGVLALRLAMELSIRLQPCKRQRPSQILQMSLHCQRRPLPEDMLGPLMVQVPRPPLLPALIQEFLKRYSDLSFPGQRIHKGPVRRRR